jgi:putative nucleotidyltransferase-like protein
VSRSLCQTIIAELAVTNGRPFDFTIWRSFNDTEWSHALDWLDLSGLALYFWEKLKVVGARKHLPAHVRTHLSKCYEENCLRVESIREESAALNKMLDGAGIQYAVLKGLTLVPDYCPDPALRTQYDHDYLIQPDNLARVESLLQRSGYIPKVTDEDYHIVYVRPVSEAIASRRLMGLYSARLERPVELHTALWDPAEERINIPLPEDFLNRLQKRRWQGFEYMALSDEDALIFQVLHAFRHILRNWCRLSTFLEFSHFLSRRASDTDFWFRFRDRSTNLRWVPEASATVFRIAQNLFGGFIPTDLNPQVAPKFSAVLDLWIERYGLPGALANFRDSKNSLFLHREFVVDRSAWTVVWRRRLFPLRRPHHLPKVLANQQARRLTKKWTQCLHGLQRFQFHAFSAAYYAWEYPRWQLLRRVPTLDGSKTARCVKGTVGRTDCNSKWSPKSVATQFNDTSGFKD